jgi:cysteine desulfurase
MTASPTQSGNARAYLDHAATTPVLPDVVATVVEQLHRPGNPSSLHGSGRAARRVVEESRERIAVALGARPVEVVLTSGGTESDNLAIKGLYWARRAADPRRRRILACAAEHHAVLDPVRWLADAAGAEVEWIGVDGRGVLEVAALHAAVERDPGSVAVISCHWANNEIGTVQPVADVVAAAARHGIPVHSDAVQALGALPVAFGRSGLDALTVTGHKVGGPFGAGALLLTRSQEAVPLLHGGGQERARSGTVDVPAVAGLAVAVEAAVAAQPARARRLAELRDRLVAGVRAEVPDVIVNGLGAQRLPGIAHLTFPGCEGDALLMLLDAQGIECSTGSACSAGVPEPSHVLLAMGVDEHLARGSLRFSLGHTSTDADVAALVAVIGPVVERARAASLVPAARAG